MSLRKKLEKANNADDATGINILQPGRNVPRPFPPHQHRARMLPWQREAPSPPDAFPVTHTTISAPAEKTYKLYEALEVEARRLLEDLHNLPDINMAQASEIVGRQTFLEECASKVASIRGSLLNADSPVMVERRNAITRILLQADTAICIRGVGLPKVHGPVRVDAGMSIYRV